MTKWVDGGQVGGLWCIRLKRWNSSAEDVLGLFQGMAEDIVLTQNEQVFAEPYAQHLQILESNS